jgi:hypothetical protein
MKEITIYECEDGSRFDDRKKAAMYDKVLETIKYIMAPLGEPVTESYSAKQRDKGAVETTVKDFMQLCAWCIPDWSDTFGKVNELEDLQRYIVGRVLSDYSKDWKCLYEAYFRLSCISTTSHIEYEQPYWTSHEDEYQEELLKHNKQNN